MKIFGMLVSPTSVALILLEYLTFGLIFLIASGALSAFNSTLGFGVLHATQPFLLATVLIAILIALDAYERRNRRCLRRTSVRLGLAGLLAFAFVLATLPLQGPISLVATSVAIATALTVTITIRWIGNQARFLLTPLHGRRLVIGSGARATRLRALVPGYLIFGYLPENDVAQPAIPSNLLITADQRPLADIIRECRIDSVVLAVNDPQRLRRELNRGDHGLPAQAIVDDIEFIESITGQVDLSVPLKDHGTINAASSWQARTYALTKRAFDIGLSVLVLVLILPLLLLAMLAVKVTSPGPIFFQQQRVGKGNQNFMLLKLRSMTDRPRSGITSQDKSENTSIGSFLRRTRLDELPQLFNIIKGDMSLVGPRPEQRALVANFERQIPQYCERYQLRPGLTGWAQIRQGHCGEDPTLHAVKVSYDLFYLRQRSFLFDLFILLQTLSVVIFGDDDRPAAAEVAINSH